MNANGCTSNLPYAFMAYTPVTLTLSLKTNARPLKRETMYYETKKYWTVTFSSASDYSSRRTILRLLILDSQLFRPEIVSHRKSTSTKKKTITQIYVNLPVKCPLLCPTLTSISMCRHISIDLPNRK